MAKQQTDLAIGQAVKVVNEGSVFYGEPGVIQDINAGWDNILVWVLLTRLHRLLTFGPDELEGASEQ